MRSYTSVNVLITQHVATKISNRLITRENEIVTVQVRRKILSSITERIGTLLYNNVLGPTSIEIYESVLKI